MRREMAINPKMRPLKRDKCQRCARRLASAGYKTCVPCRAEDRERQQARRQQLVRQGKCARCATRRREKGLKMCRPCLDECNDAATALQLFRKRMHLCTDCGKPAAVRYLGDGSVKQLVHCEEHLEIIRDRQQPRTGSDPRASERVRAWKERQRAKGNCTSCGRLAYYDPKAGVLRSMCRMHLDKAKRSSKKRSAAQVT